MAVARVLAIPRNFESLASPLKSSIGLKYSAVALSSSIICLGTNTGSTYVFERESLKLVKFIASKGGNIEILQFSKDEKLLAIADSTGIVTCLEVNEEKHELKVTKEIEDHKRSRITALTWDDYSARLFIGDEGGFVTAVIVAPFKLPAGKFLSKSTIEVVVKGESPIVQLDFSELKLLVSTTTRTLLCSTDKSKYQQIGSKPRDGKFGSCFLQYVDGQYPVIYAGRPGSRLWEIDFNGQVLVTHQLKHLLATSPTKLCGFLQGRSFHSDSSWDKPQSVAFPKLIPLCNRFLVTWSSYALYIFDANLGKIAGWYDEIKGIKDVSCNNGNIFVVNEDGEVLGLEFMPLKDCLKCLISMSEYHQAAEISIKYRDDILKNVESYLTIDFEAVKDKLSESELASVKNLIDSLSDLIEKLQLRHDQIRAEIQERLNGFPNQDESSTPCDSGVEDNDEVRSNQSEVISETSSRLSLSRLSQVDVDRVLRRATNTVFNKIASSGFMKRVLNNVKDETRRRSVSPQLKDLESPRDSTSPDSPRSEEVELHRLVDVSDTNSSASLHQLEGIDNERKEMGNIEQKALDRPGPEVDGLAEKISFGKRPVPGRRRRKAKVVTVDFDTPEKEETFKTTSFDTARKSRIRRIISADSASSYTQVPDTKRKGSLPHHTEKGDSNQKGDSNNQESEVIAVKDPIKSLSSHPTNIIAKAKQLVRKVIHTEHPAPFDVGKAGDHMTQSAVPIQSKLTCLMVCEDAMKTIPKFVDFTAVCRNKLRDSRILFNSKTVKKILQDWAEKLAETVKEFSVAMANDIEKKNSKHMFTNGEAELLLMRAKEEFFIYLGAAFSEISNLAILCFEAGIFPASCSDFTMLEKQLIENKTSFQRVRQEVVDILNKDDFKEEISDSAENADHQEFPHRSVLLQGQSSDKLQLHEVITLGEEDVVFNEQSSNELHLHEVIAQSEEDAVFSGPTATKKDGRLKEDTRKEDLQQRMKIGFERSTDNEISGSFRAVEDLPISSPYDSSVKLPEENVQTLTNSNIAESLCDVKDPQVLIPNDSASERPEKGFKIFHGAFSENVSNVTESFADRSHFESESSESNKSQKNPNSEFLGCLQDAISERSAVKRDANEASSSDNNYSSDVSIPSSSLRDYVNVQVPKKTCFLQDNIEMILCTSDDPQNCQSCHEDACRACFVLRYFPLLDLNKIRTVLGWKQGCRWRTWLAYLIHIEDATFSEELQQAILIKNDAKMARILYDSQNVEHLFCCVRRLLPSLSSVVFDLCTEEDVPPWEVCFIYMIDISEFDSLTNFLTYFSTLRRLKPSVNPLEDISVAMTILYCSLKYTSNSHNINQYYCDCGAAREGAHLLPWAQKKSIDDVISVVLSKDPYCGLVGRAFDLCRRYGYWQGCIRILRIRKEHKQAFELISQLGDFNLINEYFMTEAFTTTELDLTHLCNLEYHTREDGSRCEPAIPDFTPTTTNESLARLLVKELGPIQAINILNNVTKDTFDLPATFYYDCMRVAEKERQQRQIVRKMLDALNSEACVENKSMLLRHIEELKNRELSNAFDSQESTLNDDTVAEGLGNSTSSSHWGLNLSLASSICPCCTLSLCLHGVSSSAGIIVFECGHAYHKHCLPEESCLVCYYKLDSYRLGIGIGI